MKKLVSRGLACLMVAATAQTFECASAADDAAAAPPYSGPTLADVIAGSGLTATGYVAASYNLSNGYPFNIHQFDIGHDSFQLDQAGFTLAYQPKEGFGALVDVIAGEDARLVHAAEDGHDNTFDIKQAFVQYAMGGLTVMAGKYVTLAGAEVISPTLNTNYSRSLLFFDNEPLTHTGIRASYALNDTLTVTGGINNGWNTTSTDYGSKTAEVGIGWVPSKAFSLTAQGYFGKYQAFDAERDLVDVVATWNVSSSLTLVLNADYDKQKSAFIDGSNATWYGVAGYVNYAINDQWRVSVRGEYEDDKDGFLTGVEQHLWEGTVTFGYSPVKAFELRLEGRYDNAGTADIFYKTVAARSVGSPDTDSLSQVSIQGIFKF